MSVELRPLDPACDADLIHPWVTHPKAAYWEMSGWTRDAVLQAYEAIDADSHHDAFLGLVDAEPAFLVETYDPARRELVGVPELRGGDLGMHMLVAPTDTPRPGFTRRVMRAVMEHCFADPGVARVVVEPDVGNERIAALNAAAGFTVLRRVDLGHKTAALSACTRDDFARSRLAAAGAVDHLAPGPMARAQRSLLAKAVAELSHERLLAPERVDEDTWQLVVPHQQDQRTVYTFRARVLPLEHWEVDAGSLRRTVDGEAQPLDVSAFIGELADELGIPESFLPTYLEELAGTLAGAAWKDQHRTETAQQLLDADHQQIEGAMTAGHPGFVANNGRVGLAVDDLAAYAPEAGRDVRLLWLGVRRSLAPLALGDGVDEEEHYRHELGEDVLRDFRATLVEHGLDPHAYRFLPIHPWQWRHRVATTFAPDVARRDLVLLGEGPGGYRPQQSVRTFFPTDAPERSYVKTALAVQNMGFVRGLSPAYMAATPAICDWVAELVTADATLQQCGFTVLREHAAVGYVGDAYHRLAGPSPQRKMVAALWRESPVPRVRAGERLATMAALLHRDQQGDSYVSALVAASPLTAREWVEAWLTAYLRPLVHCLLAYDLCFMPHGENVILVLADHVPVRAIMKDVGEEVAVLGDQPLPEGVERIRADVAPDERALAIHTDVFDGVLRHVAAQLDSDGTLPAEEFWVLVAACLQRHEEEHPGLAEQVARYDLRRPRFRHSCLNRLQLRNPHEMVDLSDPAGSLVFAGTLANPAAPHASAMVASSTKRGSSSRSP